MYTCAMNRIKTALQTVAVTICHNRINYLALIKASDTLGTEFLDGLVGLFIRPKYFPLQKSNFLTCTLLGLSPAGGCAPRCSSLPVPLLLQGSCLPSWSCALWCSSIAARTASSVVVYLLFTYVIWHPKVRFLSLVSLLCPLDEIMLF